ncbi:hypothetical protein DPV78_008761 [Talaromyces pinophilus]|nr:hypothetical protein DPV78_008761 [Talaromyces pinophilus]
MGLRRRADRTLSARRSKLMERSYTQALLGEDKWLTVVVERKVKQAVSETGANARRQRLPGCRMSQAIPYTA